MTGADDAPREDRPADLPPIQSAVDEGESRKRKNRKDFEARQQREWFGRQLRDPNFRRFVWDILAAAGTFEERYGFGPNGFPHPEATWRYAGQKDLGLRLYHSWSCLDRAGMLSVMDEFHPQFPKDKP